MLLELLTVVRHEEHDGAFEEVAAPELIDQGADRGVQVGDLRIVESAQVGRLGGRRPGGRPRRLAGEDRE